MKDTGGGGERRGAESESEDLVQARRLVDAAGAAGVAVRLFGGLAVQARAGGWLPARRAQRDIDLAARRRDKAAITDVLGGLGYLPDRRFNALHGHKQLYFVHSRTGVPVDVVLDALDMCHRLEFAERLETDPLTLPLADLLLTKLQIVRLNHKDLTDAFALLHEYPLGDVDADTINLGRLTQVTSGDWGWWRTVTGNLDLAVTELPAVAASARLDRSEMARIRERLEGLRAGIDQTPKSLRWKLRASVGERVRWYEEPEEEEHG